MTANEIITLEAIKISTETIIDGNFLFADLRRVRAAAAAAGVTKEQFDAAIIRLWNAGKVTPHQGNVGRFDDKSDLFIYDGDCYTSVSTTI